MDEVDRYSQGLAREELRKCQLLKPRDSIQEFLINIIKRGKGDFLYKSGSLSEQRVRATRYKSLEAVKDLYCSFNERRFKAKISDGASRIVDSFFYWSPREMNNGEDGHGNYLVLYRFNMSFTTKEIIYDNQNCMVYTTFHMLYRMLERGMIARQPLKYLSESLNEWLGWCAFYMSAYEKVCLDGSTGLIPFCGGAILCTVGKTAYDMSLGYPKERQRLISNTRGRGSLEIPTMDIFETKIGNKRGSFSIDLNTWISGDQFSLEQEWAVDRLIRLKKQHPNLLPNLADLMFDPYIVDRSDPERDLDNSLVFLEALFKMTSDKKWARACSW